MRQVLTKVALLTLLGSVWFATSTLAGDIMLPTEYSCCGNRDGEIDPECRYLNRDLGCTSSSVCNSGSYLNCCTNACIK